VLAIIAALCFLLALLGVHIGTVNLVTLGLLFIALDLVVPVGIPMPTRRRGRPAVTD